jgi:GT2 family glycosyltransferase
VIRVRRPLAGEPSVEAIVLFRDRPELLRRCTDSLLGRTSYDNLRVRLVDNGSRDPETAELLAGLDRDPRVVVARDGRPFNFAALNNAAVDESSADYVLFLNNDTEVLDEAWIECLLEEAQRPDVGAVAPLLIYPNGTVQHAGAVLGMHDYAGHPFAGLQPGVRTPFGSALDGTRNWLAVTAACMLVERRKFESVGRFDETFVVAGNDVDLCLRLTAAGYRSLCVPHVRLIHDESRTRGTHIDPADFERSRASYGAFRTVGDPFYNPGLTLVRTDCGLRGPEEL